MLKTASSAEIMSAVRDIAGGGIVFSADQLRASRTAAWESLASTEHRILVGLLLGRSNDEVAVDVGLSQKTVESHFSRLFAHYGVMTRTELALVVDRGLLLQLPVKDRRRRP